MPQAKERGKKGEDPEQRGRFAVGRDEVLGDGCVSRRQSDQGRKHGAEEDSPGKDQDEGSYDEAHKQRGDDTKRSEVQTSRVVEQPADRPGQPEEPQLGGVVRLP